MTFHSRTSRLALRWIAAAIACLALAAPSAPASAVDQRSEPSSSCEVQWEATYHTKAPRGCEDQVLASRSTGAPTGPATATNDAPSVTSTDSGFDWGAAAVGAAGAAGLIALFTFATPARLRRRVRTAR